MTIMHNLFEYSGMKSQNRVGKVWRSLNGETHETLNEMVERQLREGGASRLREYAEDELYQVEHMAENDKRSKVAQSDNHTWDRLIKTKDFESTEARKLAKKWKTDGKLPRQLADAWMSKGLVSKNDKEKIQFLADKTIRVRKCSVTCNMFV